MVLVSGDMYAFTYPAWPDSSSKALLHEVRVEARAETAMNNLEIFMSDRFSLLLEIVEEVVRIFEKTFVLPRATCKKSLLSLHVDDFDMRRCVFSLCVFHSFANITFFSKNPYLCAIKEKIVYGYVQERQEV